MPASDESGASTQGRQSKVRRHLSTYEMEDLGPELERRWTAEEDRWSLRDLANFFNQRLLEATLEESGVSTLEGEVENTYRLLTDEDVGGAERTRARRRLEREGIDVDELLDDFVTYQAIRTYLRDHRGAEYDPDETDPLERVGDNVEGLRGRMASVTEGKLARLRDAGHLDLGEFRTLANIQVVCEDCNTRYDAGELLDRGGCDCDE